MVNKNYPESIRVITRKSPLALWQARFVCRQLHLLHPHWKFQIITLTTYGDEQQGIPLFALQQQGVFSQTLTAALLEQKADFAVHSMKDLPLSSTSGVAVDVVGVREDPREALVTVESVVTLDSLPLRARVGTSSLSRHYQLRAIRPDLRFIPLRGEILSRLQRLDQGEYDALILAVAGLKRLGLTRRISAYLPLKKVLPAAAQGALAVQYCTHNRKIAQGLPPLFHLPTQACVGAERAFASSLSRYRGVVSAVYAKQRKECLYIRGMVTTSQSKQLIYGVECGLSTEAEQVGRRLAKSIVMQQQGMPTPLCCFESQMLCEF